MSSNDEKTDMILIYASAVRLSTISFNQANDVYVKIYETARQTMFYVFWKKKQTSTLTLQMYCGLHFQFRRVHYHSWNTLYLPT
jgi:hypothetical protein